MNRQDIIGFEAFYAATLRREAGRRAKRQPAVAEQLTRFADAAEARIEAIKCGPLFDREDRLAPEDLQPIGPIVEAVAAEVLEKAQERADAQQGEAA